MSDIEAIDELRKVRAEMEHYSGLMVEASNQLEVLKKENKKLRSGYLDLICDLDDSKYQLEPESIEKIKEMQKLFEGEETDVIQALLNNQPVPLNWD